MGNGFDFALAPFPLSKGSFRNGPERSRARRFCAAERTLDGEDRSGAFVGHVKPMFIRGGTEIKPEPPVTPIGMGKSTRGVEPAAAVLAWRIDPLSGCPFS
jgi:hypothetical protein